jgi:enoyl-CoA hydratase
MPECGLGLFPDVGAGWLLPRRPGALGPYLALTGARLGAADALHAGFASHFMPSARLAQLIDRVSSGEKIEALLQVLAERPDEAPLARHRDAIDRCFGRPTIAAIRAALAVEASDWAAATTETLARLSPTSLAITLEQLRRGRDLDYPAVVTMEYRMSQACMAGHDFYEGVRAIVVDKDRRPRWQPATSEELTPALVAAHFAQPAAGDLVVG